MIRQFFYVSRCLAAPQELEQILGRARFHNERRQVTGALIFTGGHFAQLLEGSREPLAETVAAIQADPRHAAMTPLVEEDIASRRYSGWAMALIDAPGADDLIQELLAQPGAVTPERAQRLLRRMFDPLSGGVA